LRSFKLQYFVVHFSGFTIYIYIYIETNWNFKILQTNKIINAKFQHYFLYYFIYTMKLFLYVDKTDVTNIYLNHIFELLLQIIDDLIVFSRHLFRSSWNYILFHMYNEISTKFQHFYLIDECWCWSWCWKYLFGIKFLNSCYKILQIIINYWGNRKKYSIESDLFAATMARILIFEWNSFAKGQHWLKVIFQKCVQSLWKQFQSFRIHWYHSGC